MVHDNPARPGERPQSTPPIELFLPVRDFTGFTRLRQALTTAERVHLSMELTSRAIGAGTAAGFAVRVVSSDRDVTGWCRERMVGVIPDPGTGLSDAASFAVGHAQGRWLVMHADLPLVAARSLATVAVGGGTTLVPSIDGGTNVISGTGPFPFSYGPGSFHRHFAAAPEARVVIDPLLTVDLDTPSHLRALRRMSPTLVTG